MAPIHSHRRVETATAPSASSAGGFPDGDGNVRLGMRGDFLDDLSLRFAPFPSGAWKPRFQVLNDGLRFLLGAIR